PGDRAERRPPNDRIFTPSYESSERQVILIPGLPIGSFGFEGRVSSCDALLVDPTCRFPIARLKGVNRVVHRCETTCKGGPPGPPSPDHEAIEIEMRGGHGEAVSKLFQYHPSQWVEASSPAYARRLGKSLPIPPTAVGGSFKSSLRAA